MSKFIKLIFSLALFYGFGSAQATVYYFADCGTGADVACVAGVDANAGTSSAAPKQTIGELIVVLNACNPGDQILTAKGGAWNLASAVTVFNATHTSAYFLNNCIVSTYVPAWGPGTARPLFNIASGITGFDHTNGGAADINGGITYKGIKIDGGGVGTVCVRLFNGASFITFDDVVINGCTTNISLLEISAADSFPNYITVKNSTLSNSSSACIGSFSSSNLVIDNNLFDGCGTASSLNHALYISGSDVTGRTAHGVVIRNNRLINNVLNAGLCVGAVIVGHSAEEDWIIENNYIYQAPGTSAATCYGIALSPANSGTLSEILRRVVIRGNTAVNVGVNCYVVGGAESNVIIEDNTCIQEADGTYTGVELLTNSLARPPRGINTNIIVRNNSNYFFGCISSPCHGVFVDNEGTGHSLINNLTYYGAGTNTNAYCLGTPVIAGGTVDIASPATITWANHKNSPDGLAPFVPTTTGALPTGMVAGNTYYVSATSWATSSLTFSATPNGAIINTSGSQSGVHTFTAPLTPLIGTANYNGCYHYTAWHPSYATSAAMLSATGLGQNNIGTTVAADAKVTVPVCGSTKLSTCRVALQVDSPLRATGNAALASRLDDQMCVRPTAPSIGANEYRTATCNAVIGSPTGVR